MYKKDRSCGPVGTRERACLRLEELVLDRGLKLPGQHNTVKEAIKSQSDLSDILSDAFRKSFTILRCLNVGLNTRSS